MKDLPTLPNRMPSAANRERLRQTVEALAQRLADGAVTPSLEELEPGGFLEALVRVLDLHGLPLEAARVRRWLRGTR